MYKRQSLSSLEGKKEHLLAFELGEFDLSPGSALLGKSLFLWNSVSMSVAVIIVILMTTAAAAIATITIVIFLAYA